MNFKDETTNEVSDKKNLPSVIEDAEAYTPAEPPTETGKYTVPKRERVPQITRQQLFAKFADVLIDVENPWCDIALDEEFRQPVMTMTVGERIAQLVHTQALLGCRDSQKLLLDSRYGTLKDNAPAVAIQINTGDVMTAAIEELDAKERERRRQAKDAEYTSQ